MNKVHLLSAYATLYAQTGSAAVKAKADSIVGGLAEVQQAYGKSGYLSAFAEGLIDRNIPLHGVLIAVPTTTSVRSTTTFLVSKTRQRAWFAIARLWSGGYGRQTGLKHINMQDLIPFYDAHHCRYVVYWQK